MIDDECLESCQSGRLYDVLYADDTLVTGTSCRQAQKFGQAVEAAGASYGMSLHWGKTQALSVRTPTRLKRPDGTTIEETFDLPWWPYLL